VLYGRRRVGKTSLIREAIKHKKSLFFEGLEDQPKSKQISNFLFQLKQQAPELEINYKIKSWPEALIQIQPLLKNESTVLVFDEFQWMAHYRRELVTNLKMVWDQYFSKNTHTSLILCGSIASFMIDKVVKSSALYGRVTLEMNLSPFLATESATLLRGKSKIEVLEAMFIFGGIPLYLNMLQNSSSIYIGINDLAFRPSSYFASEFDRIFVSHFGKKADYNKIVRALMKNEYGLFRENISKECQIPLSGHLSKDLFDLESAGFIKSFVPLDKGVDSKIKKYFLSDPYIRFFLAFIEPNLKSIASKKDDLFLKLVQTPKFYSFLGKSFELFCQIHSHQISRILGFSGIEYQAGPYFRKNGAQIDLLFDRMDHVITLCEIKYTRAPVGVEVIREVEAKVKEIEKFSKKTIQKVLIVKDDITQELFKSGYFYKIIQSSEFF
jgi:AAA+ ATPase superfamily predicted ATPase